MHIHPSSFGSEKEVTSLLLKDKTLHHLSLWPQRRTLLVEVPLATPYLNIDKDVCPLAACKQNFQVCGHVLRRIINIKAGGERGFPVDYSGCDGDV